MSRIVALPDRSDRVAAVLARATALSDELRGTIWELDKILKREGEELDSERK